jgi:OOP family OmpA-OmpF porin
LGLTYEVADNFMLRTDVRYRYNNNMNNRVQTGSTEFNDMTVNVGFVIPFGEKPQHMAKAEPRPVPVERAEPLVTVPKPVVDPCHGRHFKSSKLDANGCPAKIVLKGEHFKFDSAELLPPAKEILDSLAYDLVNDPQKTEVEAKGYASSEGGKVHNQRLSERRARSVVEYLKAKGVTNKLTAKGLGIADPIGDNATEAGREENRRVELIWIEN